MTADDDDGPAELVKVFVMKIDLLWYDSDDDNGDGLLSN